jgi:ribosomal protein S18 acetylase RimI-like enzyme
VGTALVEYAAREAGRRGCTRLWCTTTNDNLDALRFYQRRGFRLLALRPGAVDRARRAVKPQITAVGAYGIPLRDEIDVQRPL